MFHVKSSTRLYVSFSLKQSLKPNKIQVDLWLDLLTFVNTVSMRTLNITKAFNNLLISSAINKQMVTKTFKHGIL